MGVVAVKKGPTSPIKVEEKKLEEIYKVESLSTDAESQAETLASNPFKDPAVAKYYSNLYEEVGYECRSAFDPNFEWEPEEEKAHPKVGCLQVDRGNLAQAVSDDLLPDLGLNTNDYNTGNTIFLVAFLLAELPSQLISKKLGPDIFIPMQMCAWSIVAACQGAMTGKVGFYICRALIGILEGGFIADLVLWLSYFYKSSELPVRLSWFWTSLSLCQILTSLLAFGILRMRGVHGMAGWRWLFIIEGIFTLCIGLAAFYLMVPSAVQTKNKLHPKGWFTEREEKIVVNRVLRDDPSKGDMHNRQGLSVKKIAKAVWDYDLWPIYAIGLLAYIPMGTIQPYMTLTLKSMGFSTFDVNLLTIPQAVIHIIFLLIITWVSERVNERALVSLAMPIMSVPFLAAIRWWPGSMKNAWVTWFLVTMVLAAPYIHAICVAWVSRTPTLLGLVLEDDKPLYHRGNFQLFWCAVAMIPLLILVKLYYVWRNKSRAAKWNAMTPEEQEHYVQTTTDEGNKRLDFRFDH
ncbi:hypothetical protein CJJ09_004531 [Candidozyma auris]|nr:hypothetical protein CJJ09_004531 [[Candida] auris]